MKARISISSILQPANEFAGKCGRFGCTSLKSAVLIGCASAVLVFLTVLCGSPAEAAPSFQGGQEQKVTVNPSSITYDEPFTISLEGFPKDMVLLPDSVTFDGKRVPVPGFLSFPGVRPVGDEQGALSFTTTLPHDVDVGTFQLKVETTPFFLATTDLTFKGGHLVASPAAVVPNQRITLSGSGFTPSRDKKGLEHEHQISGRGSSFIRIGGVIVSGPYVEYPIELDAGGNFFARITIPDTRATQPGSDLKLEVTDSNGRKGTTHLSIPSAGISVDPVDAYPLQRITLTGQGFLAGNPFLSLVNQVTIIYRSFITDGDVEYFITETMKTVMVDQTGNFETDFNIPASARIPSSNQILVTPTFGDTLQVNHWIPSAKLTVTPSTALVGDEVGISLVGLHRDYYLSAGSLQFGGVRASLPGIFGVSGNKLKTDAIGSVTFTTTVPFLPAGPQPVTFTRLTGEVVTASLTIKEGSLQVIPPSAVPGQVVFIRSRDFSPSSDDAPRPLGNHQISGSGESVVKIGETKIRSAFVDYPVPLGLDGQGFFKMRVPTESAITSSTELQLSAVDTGGRRSNGKLIIRKPSVTLSPESGLRDSYVTLKGEGFVAGSDSLGNSFVIDIQYGDIEINSVYPDSIGNFEKRFRVPKDAKADSQHKVTAKVRQLDIQASTLHRIPAAEILINPDAAPIGATVTINGSGFPVNSAITKVGIGRFHAPVQPPAVTDGSGNFSVVVTVPQGLGLGANSFSVSTHYFAKVGQFRVIP